MDAPDSRPPPARGAGWVRLLSNGAGAAEPCPEGFLSRLLRWLTPARETAVGVGAVGAPRKRVLLVDDDPDGAEALVGMFRKCGYDAEAVPSGGDGGGVDPRGAAGGRAGGRHDAGGMDGVELLRTIRADPATARRCPC